MKRFSQVKQIENKVLSRNFVRIHLEGDIGTF